MPSGRQHDTHPGIHFPTNHEEPVRLAVPSRSLTLAPRPAVLEPLGSLAAATSRPADPKWYGSAATWLERIRRKRSLAVITSTAGLCFCSWPKGRGPGGTTGRTALPRLVHGIDGRQGLPANTRPDGKGPCPESARRQPSSKSRGQQHRD